jgi:hypothetical protein
MTIMMVSELAGAGPEVLDGLRALGVFDKMNSAPGFLGHWSGTTDNGICAIELWESPEAHQAWFDSTIKPNLPPGVEPPQFYVHVLNQLRPS